ncbi:TOBE domain-containing protein, partial [Rhizobium ruizarguesonis]
AGPSGQSVPVGWREELFGLKGQPGGAGNTLAAKVADCVYQGDHLRVQLDSGGHGFVVRLDRKSAEWQPGAQVFAEFQPSDCRVIAS